MRNVINYGYDMENNLTNFTDRLMTVQKESLPHGLRGFTYYKKEETTSFSWIVEANELKVNLCLDNVVFAEKKIASGAFIDFSGATTAVGGHNSGQYQMLGKLEQFSHYSNPLTVSELGAQYAKGRGASVKYTYKPDARLEKRSIKTGVLNTEIATTYEYDSGKVVNAKVSDTTTVKKITTNGKTISYTRNGNGNIETIIRDGKIIANSLRS